MDNIAASFTLNWPNFSLHVDLQLPGHGVSVLFGHSGSGKTTLLRCIAGLEKAQQGSLSIGGTPWQSDSLWVPPHRRPIGYVFQETTLFNHLNVMGNLTYGMKRAGVTAPTRLNHIISLLGITHLLNRKCEHLSGGERQRIGIARALAVDPQLLLMDEPLAALDLQRKREILPYLERLRDELDIPIIYVSHAIDEVMRLADHLVVLEQGNVVADGPLDTTLSQLPASIALGGECSAILNGIITTIDPLWHLAKVEFNGAALWIRDPNLPIGHAIRVRILARDVSLAREKATNSSILNIVPGHVTALIDDEHPSALLVNVAIGQTTLLAKLTRRSAAHLNLKQGDPIWIQIKSVALVE